MGAEKIPDREECLRQIQYAKDEIALIEKKENGLQVEKRRLEDKMDALYGSSYRALALAVVLTTILSIYLMYELSLGENGWYRDLHMPVLCMAVLFSWIYAFKRRRLVRIHRKIGMYGKKTDLFEKPTLAAQIENIEKDEQILQGNREAQLYKINIWRLRLEAMGGKDWQLYEKRINTEFTEEEKEEIARAVKENDNFRMQKNLEQEILELMSEKRLNIMRENAHIEKRKRLRLLLSVEILVMLVLVLMGVFVIPFFGTKFLTFFILVNALSRLPVAFALVILLLLFIPSYLKYMNYGNSPLIRYIKHKRGRQTTVEMIKELQDKRQELEEEEKKLRHKKALLEMESGGNTVMAHSQLR